jgi:amino acid adenylation domain-containing protein
MMEDSGAAVVVSSGAMRLSGSVPVVRLDEEWNTIACRSGADAGVKLEGENLAYVIYTSGSTGRQKGVGIRHSSAGVLVQWAQQEYSGEETAVVLAGTSVCFDLSVYEIFVPLSRGGKVVVVENALELAKLEGGAGITLVNTVPSAMAELVRSRSLPEGLRVVNLAGEALPPSLVQQVYGQAGGVRVMNLYGPTEDTTYSTYEWVKVEEARGGRVSIGRPVANTQAYVLDGQMQPVGAGMRGELYLGGEGLARGYVNRPELTAEKFVPHPYGGRGGERLYRTGDLVRWREDGKLEFLGRADHQVKLRGYRIELGEIEAVLREHAGVEEAVVVVREERGGDRRLVAYYTVRKEKEGREEGGDGVGAEELRVYIGEKLPGYMIPAAYVRLPKLPLTANGKLDRKALPAPDKKQESEQSEYIAPRTRLEEVLAHIWAQVLGVTRVGVKDDFFALGGNSLSAMRLLALTEARFGKKLPLAAVLRKPTIKQFIALFQDQNDNAGSSCLVPLRTTGSRRPLFFVHPIGGNVYCYRGLANLMNKERPIYAFQSQAFTGLPPHSSIAEMAEAYLNEMIAFQPNGPYFLTGWSMGGVVAFEMARQLKSRKLPVALLALIDSYPGFLHKEWNLDDHLTALISFARDLGLTAQELATLRDNEPGLTEDQMLQSVIRCVNDNEMLPRELESGEAIRMFDVFKRNAAALHSYEPQGFYEEKILLFKAAIRPRNIDLKKAWSRICSNVESHVIPGDHYAILRRPGVEILAERLDSTLEFAETGLKAKKSA